ncbi:craniofacial development protein 2-like [Harmonia axyridis]|uniref:craniofacial development protein 2-like n=1 Tax=Harmonia axyridis TaxID=115357 RepID=UPI001E2752B2|nr:craniofacial development protein 2-like [Harmonia axyridis]
MASSENEFGVTDHGSRKPRSGRVGTSNHRASQIVIQRNPCDLRGNKGVKTLQQEFKVATWNVRTLFEAGEVAKACRAMDRLNIQILGLSEVRWPGSGTTQTMNKKLYYSGNSDNSKHSNGVGIIIGEELSQAVSNFPPVSDRNLLIQLSGKPMNINIIQTYAPTADKPTAELEAWHKELEELIKVIKKEDLNFIMGDFNAKIGQGRVLYLVGDYG